MSKKYKYIYQYNSRMPRKQDSDKDRQTPKSKTPKKRGKNNNKSRRKEKRPKNKKLKYKNNTDSDSDPEWLPGDDDDMSTLELQKLMQQMFPSKAGKERLKKLEKLEALKSKNLKKSSLEKLRKNTILSEDDDEDDSSAKIKSVRSRRRRRRKKAVEVEEEIENEDENEDEEEDEEDEEDEYLYDEEEEIDDDYDDLNAHLVEDEEEEFDEEEIMNMLGQNMRFNIVFTVPGGENGVFSQMEEVDELEDIEDDSDEEDSSDESKKSAKKKETGETENLEVGDKVIVEAKDWDEPYSAVITKVGKRNHFDVRLDDKDLEKRKWRQIHRKYIKKQTEESLTQEKLMEEMSELLELRKNKGSEAMMKHFNKLSAAAEKENKKKEERDASKQKDKNVMKLRKLFRARGPANEFKFFRDMELQAQKHIITQLKEVNKYTNVDKPYRLSLLESDIPVQFKAVALKKLNILNYMDPSSGEYYKIKQWVDAFMRIPFGKITHLPVQVSDGRDACSIFMEEAKQILDDCVYGLNDAKMQIMQFLGQLIANPNSVGTAIGVHGPPGTGKTTLIKEGISKILKRPFALIALGGATDASFLEGHSYTYEGSSWGKIVDILLASKTMNPLIYFDELDKISDTPKGEEITGILTHLIDTSQSDQFHDKYFSSISFDVSKTLFIFSYNDEKKINPILKDRMYRIHTDGYSTKDKIVIAKDHLIPKIAKNINFKVEDVTIDDKTLGYIIDRYTEKERGVRNLKRCLEILYTKINLYKMMKPDSKLFDGQVVFKITSPFAVTEDIVKKLIKAEDYNASIAHLYI